MSRRAPGSTRLLLPAVSARAGRSGTERRCSREKEGKERDGAGRRMKGEDDEERLEHRIDGAASRSSKSRPATAFCADTMQ